MRTRGLPAGAQRGSALLSVLFTVIALSGLAAAIVSTALYRQSEAQALHESRRAFSMAMTGVDLATYELQEGVDLGADGIGNASGTIDGHPFESSVAPAFAGRGQYTVTAGGRVGAARQGVEIVLTTERKFPYALFADESVELGGTYSIDSYDATLGSYASQLWGDHAGASGDVGSNGDIYASGGTIFGDAVPGPGGQVLGDPSSVTGSTSASSKPLVFEPFVYAPTIASIGELNSSVTLSTGAYRYDEVELDGGAALTITGDVEIYVDQDIEIGGNASIVVAPGATVVIHHGVGSITVQGTGIVNSDQLPASITIFSASTETIKFGGTADYFGLLYATEADFVAHGNADLYGVVIAETIDVWGSGMMHYDESLEIPNDEGRFYVISAYRVSAAGI